MNEVELKPCPFCGRTDKLIIQEVSQQLDDTDIKQYTVVCNTSGNNAGCGANCGYRHFTKQDAIAAWNKRIEKSGHWIHGHCGVDDYIKCSECSREVVQNIVTLEGDLPEDVFNLCPFCGARKGGEKR